MPRKRLSGRKIREALRQKFGCGLTDRQIARSYGVPRSTVAEYFRRFASSGLSWPLPDGVDDVVLTDRLFPSQSTLPKPMARPLPDWIGSHVRALEYIGGSTIELIPDNLKSAVTRPGYYEPEINPTYEKVAAHYGTVVLPARVRKPRDKAKVEAGVLLVTRWILARLRNRTFFSLFELNEAIRPLLEALNNRPFRKLSGSRRSLFETQERAATIGPNTEIVVEKILAGQGHPVQGYKRCFGILRLSKQHGIDRLEAACVRALAIHSLTYQSIHSILKTASDKRPLRKQAAPEALPAVAMPPGWPKSSECAPPADVAIDDAIRVTASGSGSAPRCGC